MPPEELKVRKNIYACFAMSLAEFFFCVLILYSLHVHITNYYNYKESWLSILHSDPDMDHINLMVYVNN